MVITDIDVPGVRTDTVKFKKKPKPKGPKYLMKLRRIVNAKLKNGKRIFQQIVKDSYGRHYGVDLNGTMWRLDLLKKKGIGYKTVGA